MTAIRVNIKTVNYENANMKLRVGKTVNIVNGIVRERNSIPYKVREEKNLENRINILIRKINSIENRLRAVNAYVSKSMDKYNQLEESLKNEAEKSLYALKLR